MDVREIKLPIILEEATYSPLNVYRAPSDHPLYPLICAKQAITNTYILRSVPVIAMSKTTHVYSSVNMLFFSKSHAVFQQNPFKKNEASERLVLLIVHRTIATKMHCHRQLSP